MQTSLKLVLVLTVFLILETTTKPVTGKRARGDRVDDDDDSSASSSSTESIQSGPIRNDAYADRPKRYDGSPLQPNNPNDPMSSSQNLNPAIASLGGSGAGGYQNPFLLNGQAGLLNNAALYQNGGLGGLGGLGQLGVNGGGLQGLNPYFGGGGAAGGLNNFQNPYAALQSQLLLQQAAAGGAGAGGLGGLYNGADAYSQQGGGIYNSFLGLNNGGLGSLGAAGAGGINPYLLGGRGGGYLGGNYLAQGLLSPYNSFSQINPYNSYPFSSRFGVGRASTRINNPSSSSNSNSNNDE